MQDIRLGGGRLKAMLVVDGRILTASVIFQPTPNVSKNPRGLKVSINRQQSIPLLFVSLFPLTGNVMERQLNLPLLLRGWSSLYAPRARHHGLGIDLNATLNIQLLKQNGLF